VPLPTNQDDPITHAACLARDIAPSLDMVLITHYPDVDTLDTLRPGETDLQTTLAVNRAVAREMLDAGVEVLVQRADRAAFRRWMSGRDDTPENRLAWIDRSRLVRGSAALEVLRLKASASPRPQTFDKAPGPIADWLLEAFAEEESGEFDALVQDLMAARRTDVLDLAIRKLEANRRTGPADPQSHAAGQRHPRLCRRVRPDCRQGDGSPGSAARTHPGR
jgi:hypothetical protein